MKTPFPLYHWSPRSARKNILRYGLRPGRLSRDRLWRSDYICFSDSPALAWALSGDLSDTAEEWDLWMVWNNWIDDLTRMPQPCPPTKWGLPTEFRTRKRVFKRHLWFVGSRSKV